MAEPIEVGDIIVSRKNHPCGGNQWTVLRTGADIKIRCGTCGRVVLMDRETFLRQRRAVVGRDPSLANHSGSMV